MSTPCFLIKPTGKKNVYYRRYHFAQGVSIDCSVCADRPGYHNAMILVREETCEADKIDLTVSADMKRDARWPTKCDKCDYVFKHDDEWQVFVDAVYANDLGVEFSLRNPPPGAMWQAPWLPASRNRAPDGIPLIVVCPGGDQWNIDGPATNGPGWTRTGEPPNITASPSIQTSNYHGFLQNGVFGPDVDRRA